ncbi:MAG: tetratricopeptide repeat protein [Candidatus Riflebacteria bacterium]|nr:tetratricopeptide repeat protein [Candidatus Riflebacteria bacterium]
MKLVRRSILSALIALLLAAPAFFAAPVPAWAAMDFMLEEKLAKAIERLETLYAAHDWDKAIALSRLILQKTAKDHPRRQRAYDIMILSVEGKSSDVLAKDKAEASINAKKTAESLSAEGGELLTAGKVTEARDKLSQAVMSFGGDAETHYLLGYAQQKLNNQADAYICYKQCVKLNPDHPRALFHLSELSFKLKRYEEAETYTRGLIKAIGVKLLDLRTRLFEQRAANLNDQAIATMRKMSALKRNIAQAQYLFGILTERRGAIDDARQAFTVSAKFDPRPMEVHYHLGQVYLRLKMYAMSAQSFEQALFIGETLLREERTRGKKLLDEKKSDEAVVSEQKAKQIQERLALTEYGLALTSWKRADPATAMDAVDKALELNPDFRQGRFARAIFLADRNEFPAALGEIREVLKKAPPASPEASMGIKMLKRLLERSIASTQGKKTFSGSLTLGSTKNVRPVTMVDKMVKDMPGIGGRDAESRWEDLFPAMREIQELIDRQNLPAAIVRLKALRGDHPDVVQIHSVLGTLYSETGRLGDASVEFREALKLNSHDPESLANLAYLSAVQGENLDEALKMAQEAVAADGSRAEFHHTLGWVWFRKGEMDKAIGELEESIKLKPAYVLARYNLGLAHYLSGNFAPALKAFETVLADRPDHAKAAMFRALTLARMGKNADAVTGLEALQKRLPEKTALAGVAGDLAKRFKLADERKTALPIPSLEHPAPITAMLKKAREYRYQGLVNRAKELYLECQRLNPTAFAPWFELGEMYAQANLYSPAQRAWEQALKLNPNDYGLQFNIGRMNHKLGRREEARKAFNSAQGLNPNDAEPTYYLGLIAYEESRFESAESHALGALRLNARHYKAMALLGLARQRQERYRTARDAFEMLYASAPRDAAIRRLARRKLWELSRLITPGSGPTYDDAHKAGEYLTKKNEDSLNGPQMIKAEDIVHKAAPIRWVHMTTDEKIWVHKNLEKIGVQGTSLPDPAIENAQSAALADAGGGSTGASLSVDEKLTILKRLQNFKTLAKMYAPPPPRMSSKYKLHEPIAPPRPVDPGDEDNKKGLAAAEKGFMSEALDAFAAARKISPTNMDVLLNIGFLNTMLGNFKSGFEAFAQVATRNPKNPFGRLGLGHLYWLGGRGREAVEEWRTMGKVTPPDSALQLFGRSEIVWKRVLDANPTDVDAHSNLGIVYMFTGRYPEALVEFGAVIKLAPTRVEHLFYQAQIYVLMYVQSHTQSYKREAMTRLNELTNQANPFPHSLALRGYLDSL